MVVPDGASVRVDVEVEAGSVVLFGRNVSGEDVEESFEDDGYGGADSRLELVLSVRTGVIEVQREA
jgi:predicted membrane protein